ncbi:hypothetical protein CerSpe_073910 [Prunus speciosa]
MVPISKFSIKNLQWYPSQQKCKLIRVPLEPKLTPVSIRMKDKREFLAIENLFKRQHLQLPQKNDTIATFHLSWIWTGSVPSSDSPKLCLKLLIYTGRRGSTRGVNYGRLFARVSVPLDLAVVAPRAS